MSVVVESWSVVSLSSSWDPELKPFLGRILNTSGLFVAYMRLGCAAGRGVILIGAIGIGAIGSETGERFYVSY